MICSNERCTGCTACKNSCPRDAIEMVSDEYGFLHPRIIKSKCIGCKLCEKVCPENHPLQKNDVLKTWAAVASEKEIHEKSTSGGIATVLATKVIADGGVVYGHRFNADNELMCSRASSLDELRDFTGTKYVQSQMNTAIKDITYDLKNGKNVVFIGSPCQVGGLLSTLGKAPDNLLTISFICGGVPSGKFLKEHLSKYKIQSYNHLLFRNGKNYGFWLKTDNGIKLVEERWKSSYFIGFDEHLIQRESCYECQYAKKERVGDLMIGDFWGLKDSKWLNDEIQCGISFVAASTLKGIQMIEKCIKEDVLDAEEHSFAEGSSENPRLLSAVARKPEVTEFRKHYIKMGFDKAIYSIYGIKYMIYRAKRRIKKIGFLDTLYHDFIRRR